MKDKCCIICGKAQKDGIMIYGRGICEKCEKNLVSMDECTDFYWYYKECIKKNITQILLQGGEGK